jgi:hypothetical protein
MIVRIRFHKFKPSATTEEKRERLSKKVAFELFNGTLRRPCEYRR